MNKTVQIECPCCSATVRGFRESESNQPRSEYAEEKDSIAEDRESCEPERRAP